jgi:hypothetical protein
MVEISTVMNLKNSVKVRYSKAEDYSIYTSAEWSCRKYEQDANGKIKVHAQWCWVRARIMSRGSGYCMLPGQQITLISIG